MQPKYSLPEIERRWLVKTGEVPALDHLPARTIEDTYLTGGRLRLRKVSTATGPRRYKLGKKYEPVADGPEPVVSVYLTETEYESLLQLRGVHVRKTRYAVAGGALDIYEQPNAGFAVFEMEFPSEEAAALYQPPGFTGQEVTRNARYSGFALAHQLP